MSTAYGILLIEVCSRRKPTDEMFSGERSMRGWMLESFPNSMVGVVDKELLDIDMGNQSRRVEYQKCLTSTIELALECSANLPQERPTMKDVGVRMRHIKSILSRGS